MNNISKIQNEQKQLERLAAQRELYSSAKRWYVTQVFGSVVIPVVLVTISFFALQASLFAAIFGIVFFIVDIIFIVPAIAIRKLKASKIQELFDCEVLQLIKSPLKAADDIAVEEVLSYYEAHNKIKSNVEKLRNWYPQIIDSVNIAYARLICQRTNCWWDTKLRVRYINAIKAFAVFLPLLILIIGLIVGMQIETIVLLFGGLIPFFRFANKEYSDHKSSADRMSKTMNYILKTWDNILNRCIEKEKLINESRIIQDEIYENRSKSPFILDIIYKAFRDKNEGLMNKTAAILVEEIKEANVDY
jgi:hypothetical protein